MNDCQSGRLGNQNVIAAKAQQPVPILEPRHPRVEGTDIEECLTPYYQCRTRAEAAPPHEGQERALLRVRVKISERLVTLVVDAVAGDAGANIRRSVGDPVQLPRKFFRCPLVITVEKRDPRSRSSGTAR